MKILIIGFGSIAYKHYQALLLIEPTVKIVAKRSGLNMEPLNNVLSIFKDEEMWQNAPYDFIIISNPTYLHAETIEQVLGLNCPIFVEKPLFHILDSSRILEKISSAGNLIYVGCNLRFLDSLVYVKEVLLPKVIVNEVNVYCGSNLPEWRLGVDFKSVYSAHSKLGGGVHLDLIHELDYIYWLFGKPQNVFSYRSSLSSLEIDSIDYASYLLGYNKFAVNVVLNYFRTDRKRSMELVCKEDTYTVDLLSNCVYSSKEIIFESQQVLTDTYKKQLEYFIVKALHTSTLEVKLMNDIFEAYEVLKICLQ
jgi:predicted dehydrogenase